MDGWESGIFALAGVVLGWGGNWWVASGERRARAEEKRTDAEKTALLELQETLEHKSAVAAVYLRERLHDLDPDPLPLHHADFREGMMRSRVRDDEVRRLAEIASRAASMAMTLEDDELHDRAGEVSSEMIRAHNEAEAKIGEVWRSL